MVIPCELNCPTFNAMRVFRIEKNPRITELIRQLWPVPCWPDAGRVHIHGFMNGVTPDGFVLVSIKRELFKALQFHVKNCGMWNTYTFKRKSRV